MRWLTIAATAVVLLAAGVRTTAQRPQTTMEVYKSATCGCCSKWVDHLRSMEVSGVKAQPFDVIAFAKDGSTRVFASHGR